MGNQRVTGLLGVVRGFSSSKCHAKSRITARTRPPTIRSPARSRIRRVSLWRLPAVNHAMTALILVVLFRPTLLKRAGDPCRSVRGLAVATVLLIWVVLLFTSRPPFARNYYILCPIALLLGYLTLGSLVETPRARRWAVAILAAGAILHIGLASQYLKLDPWADRRVAPKRAIEQKDYRILAERRPHRDY